jgi:hypothetical protein
MRKSIILIAIILTVNLAACSVQPKWTLLDPMDSPPALVHSGFAYDTNLQEAIVFGGIYQDQWSDDTWIWDGSNWQKAKTLVAPPAREKGTLAYDENREKVVLFGGSMDKDVFDDTWEWDGKTWQEMEPAHQPPARCCHAMAYDSVQKKVLLYGGWNAVTGQFFNDSWEWDGEDWEKLSSGNLPLAAGHVLINFSSEHKVIAVPSGKSVNTWAWDGSQWSEIVSHPTPARADSKSAYVSEYNKIVFFGGATLGDTMLSETPFCGPGLEQSLLCRNTTYLADTWVFDGRAWYTLDIPSSPDGRFGHVLFYDMQRNSIILFGGIGEKGLLGDTWELTVSQDPALPRDRLASSADQTSAP